MRPPIGWHPFRGWGRESEKFGWSEGARENEAEEGRGGISMLPYLMNAAEAPIQNADWRIGEEGKSRGLGRASGSPRREFGRLQH